MRDALHCVKLISQTNIRKKKMFTRLNILTRIFHFTNNATTFRGIIFCRINIENILSYLYIIIYNILFKI